MFLNHQTQKFRNMKKDILQEEKSPAELKYSYKDRQNLKKNEANRFLAIIGQAHILSIQCDSDFTSKDVVSYAAKNGFCFSEEEIEEAMEVF